MHLAKSAAAPLLVVFVALALGACKGGGASGGAGEDLSRLEPSPTASSIPPLTVANAIGTCDDIDMCARECDAGSGDLCGRLGANYEFGTNDAGKDQARGTAYYDRACALGSATGCVSSGRMHEYGHGVPKDFPVATAAYEKACGLGWQVGCANWAIMLENGRGVP
ncbi:MAG TPA: tetratricopeptide repeat protein, partial [Polyangiaceae bacterium]